MRAARPRVGFTLLEVMLATGLLLGCVIVLAELAAVGREHANAAEDLATAQRLCQNRLNEILSGAGRLDAVDNEELDEEGWTCAVSLEAVGQIGLIAVRVTVRREAVPTRRAREFSLVRWIPDPSLGPGEVEDLSPPGATSPESSGGGMP